MECHNDEKVIFQSPVKLNFRRTLNELTKDSLPLIKTESAHKTILI